jgi:hypothetical protein
MIKANELRIGNYILINGSIVRIGYGVIQDVYQKNKGIRNQYLNTLTHEPIPLTPEILEKAGFVKNPKNESFDLSIRGMGIIVIDDQDHSFTIFDNHKDVGFTSASKQISVHQLQNLYFALTGEELDINL